jgi:hypothetical protein
MRSGEVGALQEDLAGGKHIKRLKLRKLICFFVPDFRYKNSAPIDGADVFPV